MICAPITVETELDDQTIRFAATVPVGGPLDADFEETLRVYSDGGPLREMGDRAAGRVDRISVDDGRVTVIGRVVDPSSIAKVKRGVLRGIVIGKRFVSLVDRLTNDAELDLVKGIFWSTFSNEMRKAANMHDPEDDDPNQANPSVVADPPDALMAEIVGLRQDVRFLRGSPADALAAVRETFRAGPRFGNMFDLRDKIPPPGDLWREMITGGDNPARDEMLRPLVKSAAQSMLESNSGPRRPEGERMTKAQRAAQGALAAAYSGSNYRMLRSNG